MGEQLKAKHGDVSELLPLLLAGYKKGGRATRSEPGPEGKGWVPRSFNVYGPKVLACISGLPPTLASRAIGIRIFRAGRGSSKPRRHLDSIVGAWVQISDDLHALALEHGQVWTKLASMQEVCPEGIACRSYKLWQPILALAWWVESQGAKGLLELVTKHALASISDAADDAVPEADEALLSIVAEAVREGRRVTPNTVPR